MMRSPLRITVQRRNAFSLVEVVLALGIVGVAFVPLLGLLSVGFSTMKESNVDVKAALIAQRLIAAAQMVPYDQLDSQTQYLDYEGKEVPQAESVFTAQIIPSTQSVLGSPNLKKVTVTLTGPAVQNDPRVFSSTVANLGD